jgi:hypothetical protein
MKHRTRRSLLKIVTRPLWENFFDRITIFKPVEMISIKSYCAKFIFFAVPDFHSGWVN